MNPVDKGDALCIVLYGLFWVAMIPVVLLWEPRPLWRRVKLCLWRKVIR